jgi:hypothetical protein
MFTPRILLTVKFLTLVILTSFYLLLGVKDLKFDVINPDGINWHTRTQAFTEALSKGKYADTFQAYHPGTTLMWISGPLLNVFKGNELNALKQQDPKSTFLERDYFAKLSVVIFCMVLFVLTVLILWKLVGFKYATIYSIFFILEPFIIGMRRLYHLDLLMTSLMFLSFLLLIYYNYKSPKCYLVVFSGLFYSLSLLTKSTAVIFLPAIPFIFLLGNTSLLKKLTSFLLFILSSLFFIYTLFPPIWNNPAKQIPEYYKKIAFGVTDIGVEGKKEIGTDGKSENIVLDETLGDKASNFYISSLFMRLSVAGGIFLIISIGVFIYAITKGFLLTILDATRSKKLPKLFTFSTESWVRFWSLGIAVAILFALTMSVKKTDRYEIIVFPFLLLLVASFLSKLKWYLSLPLVVLYVSFVLYEIAPIHPYYLAYSNPYLGGIETRLRTIDKAPFGIASYEAFSIVKKDREVTGYSGYYTISGSKSIKAISAGGKFSRSPSCVTDYMVDFVLDEQTPTNCVQKFTLLGTVKVSGFDYWYVYKRISQKHESNYN